MSDIVFDKLKFVVTRDELKEVLSKKRSALVEQRWPTREAGGSIKPGA